MRMLRVASTLFLLQAGALALSIANDESSFAEVDDQQPDDGIDRSSFHKAVMGNPMRQIEAKASPFYTAKQARKFKLAYDEYLAHPIVKRYMTKNNLMAVVPEKKVQQELLESILPSLSPYAKLGFLSFNLPPHYVPAVDDNGSLKLMREGQQTLQEIKKFLEVEMKDKLECVVNFWKVMHQSDVTLHDNHLHPYDGLQMWVMINTNNTQVRELVINHANNLFKDILPKGVKDLDSRSSGTWQFLPVLSEGTFLISKEKKKFSVGDIGKNIIISNQHGIASGYVSIEEDREDGSPVCTASRKDILFEAEIAPVSRTTRFIHQKIFTTWTPAWQRFNYLMYQLRKQAPSGRILVKQFQDLLARPDVNQDCKVVENKVLGGKTWETRCILGKDTLKWMAEKAPESDMNKDGEIDFNEYLAFSTDVWSTFQPTAPAYTPPTDGSVRKALKDYVEDWWNDDI